MTTNTTESHRLAKRPKSRLACGACRERKTNCDGARPVCQSCTRTKFGAAQCIYSYNEPHVETSSDYVNSLEDCIHELEALHSPLATTHDLPQIPVPDLLHATSPRSALFSAETEIDPDHVPNHGAGSPNVVSTMSAAGGTSTNDLRPMFLDRSRATAFMDEVPRASSRKRGYILVENTSDPRKPHSRTKRKYSEVDGFLEPLTLPPKPVADAYMACYWDHIHPTVPILHRTSFMSKYDKVWTDSSVEGTEPSTGDGILHSVHDFYGTLNMALALGCSFSPYTSDQDSDSAADVFFSRASNLLTLDSIESGSMQTVQALVLTVLFLQSTDRINACWITIGMAIRIAQAIGVNVDDPSDSQAQLEERRRTWWYCVLLDRTYSMIFGRAPMVGGTSVIPMPALVDDDQLSTEPESSLRPAITQEISIVAFLLEALKLSDVLMEVAKVSGAPHSGSREQWSIVQDFTAAQMIDEKLNRWRQCLPTYLRFPSGPTGISSLTFTRQAVALKCRYLHLQILLFRPIIVRLAQTGFFDARNEEKSTYVQRIVARGCVASCVSAAEELIEILRTESEKGNMPPWWYSIFYLYTAETVILAVLVTPDLSKADNHNPDFLEMTWQQGLEYLAQYDLPSGTFAARCRSVLLSARQRSLRKSSITKNTENQSTNVQSTPEVAQNCSYDASPAVLLLVNAPDTLFKEENMDLSP